MSAVLACSCTSYKEIGRLNMVSERNIDSKGEYILLRSYMGGAKNEIKESRKNKVYSIDDALNRTVKATPGGEFLKNVKVFLVDGKYIAVEGDVWGFANVEQQYRGFVKGDHVLYKSQGKNFKGSLTALKNDKICYFQEFGSQKIVEIGYTNITKTNFPQSEIDEYISIKQPKDTKKK